MPSTKKTTILGIDPGSKITGFGVILAEQGKIQYLASGVIRSKADNFPARLMEIYSGVREIVALHKPTEIAIEEVFVNRNVASALKLGQARGAAIVAAASQGCVVGEYTARQIKQAVVGYGNASKEQVQHMVSALLDLSKAPASDAADGLAIAICHVFSTAGALGQLRRHGFRKGRLLT